MTTILWALFGYTLFIGAIICIHEWGHYRVARLFGIRVLRFSIGLGPVIWRRASPSAGEWAISLIPLGGYVKFDEAPKEAPPAARVGTFAAAPAHARMLVALAGPAINLVTAAVFFALAALVQGPSIAPVLGEPLKDTPLLSAGLHSGDRVVEIDGRPISDYADLYLQLLRGAVTTSDQLWRVQRSGREVELQVPPGDFESIKRDFGYSHGLVHALADRPVVVENVARGQPAEGILRGGDQILAIDGHLTPSFRGMIAALENKGGQVVHLRWLRGGEELEAEVALQPSPEGSKVGVLGIYIAPGDISSYLEQAPRHLIVSRSLYQVYDHTLVSAVGLLRLVTGKMDVRNISGPIQIAQATGRTARAAVLNRDLSLPLALLGALSVGVAFFNLLPIPITDGGQAVIALTEMLRGRSLQDKALLHLQYAGLAIMGFFFVVALYSDALSLMQ